MAFNKIQPQQLQLPTFSSDSGNITFEDNGGSSITVELNNSINSDTPFDFLGGLQTKSVEVLSQSSGINLEGTGNVSIGQSGASNMRGVYNVALGGMTSDFNVTDCGYNASLSTQTATFGSNSKSNVCVGGNSITFSDQTTGAIVLAASDVGKSVSSANGGQIFIMSNSGTNFAGNGIVSFGTDVEINETSLTMTSSSELVVSGTSNFHGKTNITGNCDITGNSTINISGQKVYLQSQTEFSGDAIIKGSISRGVGSDEFYDYQQQKTYTMDFVTGGLYNSTGHFIVHHSVNGNVGIDPIEGNTGSILLQVSGWRFEVDGTWRSADYTL